MRLQDPCFKIRDQDLSVLSVPRFQVTGMIERSFLGLNFSISRFFLVGKVWQVFFG